jgi:uncharacterized secreted protein with C-terminal beta-propeller domain
MSRLFTLPLPALLVLGALSTGCNPTQEPLGGQLDPRVLYGFESCDDMLGYTKARANELIDEYGNIHGYDYSQGWGWGAEDGVSTGGTSDGGGDSGGDPGEPQPGDGDDNGGGGNDYSGTNVQEAGVDEPDLIKTDGDRIVAFARGKLHFVDASGATPTLRGSLPIAQDIWDAQMFLHENRVLLLARTWPYYYYDGGEGLPGVEQGVDLQKFFGPDFYGSVLRMVEVDISDPDNLKIVSNLYLTGDLVSARMVEGVSRVVVRSNPNGLQWKSPDEFFDHQGYWDKVGDNWNEALYQAYWNQAVAQAKQHNHSVVDGSKAENWMPRYVHEVLSGGEAKTTSGLLLGCDSVMHPGEYSGLSMLSVLTVDLNANLTPGGGVGVFSEGETVYASKENLYVATTPWHPENWNPDGEDEQKGLTTYVHKFDIKARDAAKYVASGAVRGWLLSQWALSEHKGDLRVASTDRLGWDTETSESFVSVLRQDGDELVQIGQVGGLGKTEQIQGVRFIGDTGYVVTFRQTDPLYTVDVADPTKPAVVGELKIPGFSAYLHPIGENLLLGVGRDGTEDGQLLGLQLSVFDVSDKKSPTQLHKLAIGEEWGWSEALFDHKAFLWWGKTGLAMLPMEWQAWDEQTQTGSWEQGAFGFTVDKEDGIELVAQVEHPDPVVEECFDEYYGCGWSPVLRRSMVIGDLVYTLSDVGLKASALAGLGDKHWIEFPQN